MKNIHLISTDKPSRLHEFGNIWFSHKEPTECFRNYNIYITSDEEIKFDEYYLGDDDNIYCLVSSVNHNGKKIVLTTDQDLIKDGVQAIDDDFLEWFVNNSSCESVDIKKTLKGSIIPNTSGVMHYSKYYQIITPKEEPKQALIAIMKEDEELGLYNETTLGDMNCACSRFETNCYTGMCRNCGRAKQWYNESQTDERMNVIGQNGNDGEHYESETLEEAAERLYAIILDDDGLDRNKWDRDVWLKGAKWQQKRMYSEEDMREAFIAGGNSQIEEDDAYGSDYLAYMEEWFKQFKNK